jgi:DNA-directed RNA polymerase specialized sigma subunit
VASRRYKARYERRGSGWRASTRHNREVLEVSSRTLESARIAIASALAKRLGEYRGWIPIDDEIELTAPARASLDDARQKRNVALQAAAASQAASTKAVRALAAEGLSRRDVAYLLGISHSRVQQLVDMTKARNEK